MNYLPVGLAALLVFPATAHAQEDCADDGNSATRTAEVAFSIAASGDDTRGAEYRYNQALEALEENWQMDDVPARSYLLAGRAYLGLRDFVGADSMLTMLVEAVPECAEQAQEMRFNAWVTQYNAGIEELKAGDDSTALVRFETANLINKDARSLAYAAQIHQQNGDTERAVELYEAALAAGGQPEIVRSASINLANLRQQAGDTQGALEIYSTYTEEHPDDVLGRLNFAIALMDAERQAEAETIFTELMAREDLTFNQWSQVGIGLYRAQNFEQAGQAFEKAYAMNPYSKETLENLANSYYQVENYEKLQPLAEKLVENYPLERVHYNLLANSFRELGKPDDALAVLQRRDSLAVEVLRSQLTPLSETTFSIDGQIMNRAAPAGTTLSIPVTFVGEDGTDLMTETLELTVPAETEVAAFALQVESEVPIAGFRYEAPTS